MFDSIKVIKRPTAGTIPDAPVRTVERVAEAKLPTDVGEFRLIGYRSLLSGEEFVVLVRGEIRPGQANARANPFSMSHGRCIRFDQMRLRPAAKVGDETDR